MSSKGFHFLILMTSASLLLAQGAKPVRKLPVVKSAEVPLYPPLARAARIQGEVRLWVATDGSRVLSSTPQSGPPMLAKAAQENVKTWKFEAHEATQFLTMFSYRLLTDSDCKSVLSSNGEVHLKLPSEIEVNASTPFRENYCDPTEGLDLSEPLRVFLTACEIDGRGVPCDEFTIRLFSGGLTIAPTRFKESEKKQGFLVPQDFRSVGAFGVKVDTPKGSFALSGQDVGFLKGKWHLGVDHAPFKDGGPLYGAAADVQCAGFVIFEWGEPETVTSTTCN